MGQNSSEGFLDVMRLRSQDCFLLLLFLMFLSIWKEKKRGPNEVSKRGKSNEGGMLIIEHEKDRCVSWTVIKVQSRRARSFDVMP